MISMPETREDIVEEQREAVNVSKGKNLKCGRLTPAAQMTILLVDTLSMSLIASDSTVYHDFTRVCVCDITKHLSNTHTDVE